MRTLYLFHLFIIIFLSLVACKRRPHFSVWRLTSSDEQIWDAFEGKPLQPVIFYFRSGEHVLRGWHIGADTLPTTLLLHGAPSSMVKYRGWFQDPSIYKKTKLVAVDRPGYGKSGYGKAVTSVAEQAAIMAPLLKKLAEKGPITICGSSYGGPIALKLAAEHPEYVKNLVLQSASVKPGAERTPKIAYWIKSPLGVFFPKWARVSTREKFAHTKALSEIQHDWECVKCPVWILHGGLDDLIYPVNALYAKEKLSPHTPVNLKLFPDIEHNMYWARRDSIKRYLLEAAESEERK